MLVGDSILVWRFKRVFMCWLVLENFNTMSCSVDFEKKLKLKPNFVLIV